MLFTNPFTSNVTFSAYRKVSLYFLLVVGLLFSYSFHNQIFAQSPWVTAGSNSIYYNPTSGLSRVGIDKNNPTCQLDFGQYGSRMISLFGSSGNGWYGFGLVPGKLRLQIAQSSSGSHSFGFFNGSSQEIANLNSNATWVMKGLDPDIVLDMDASSSRNLLEFVFRIGGSRKGDFRYNRLTDELGFWHNNEEVMTIDSNDPNDFWLTVNKGIQTGKIKVDASLADYVFDGKHVPMSLEQVEKYVWQNHHLPGVVSQKEVDQQGGVDLAGLTIQLQEKLEELYLHVIELNKEVKSLKEKNQKLKLNMNTSNQE
ncbi:MAG: hypothetical protein AAFY71_09520 [Bacteroidota bacterium]